MGQIQVRRCGIQQEPRHLKTEKCERATSTTKTHRATKLHTHPSRIRRRRRVWFQQWQISYVQFCRGVFRTHVRIQLRPGGRGRAEDYDEYRRREEALEREARRAQQEAESRDRAAKEEVRKKERANKQALARQQEETPAHVFSTQTHTQEEELAMAKVWV